MPYVYLLIAIIAEVVGTSLLPKTEGFTKLIPTIILILCYVFAFSLLSIIVKSLPIGIVYALWSAGGIVLVSVVGYFVYKQSLDFPAILGLSLIVIGVIIINVFSKTSTH